MKLTGHAKLKLEIYGISENAFLKEYQKSREQYYDEKENSLIQIIQWQAILLAVICDADKGRIITIYRTDRQTIINRQKNTI